MKIDKGSITEDFIDVNKRQYVIPVYQRNYEWSEEQCRKLFDDIVSAHERQHYHFCGSVVYAPLGSIGKVDQFVIIDGQQRLTTIYILIKALMDLAETDKQRESLKESLMNKDKFNQYTTDISTKLKLKPIKSDNNQLLLLMDNKQSELNPNSGIARNYRLFCELIREYLNSHEDADVTHIYDGIEYLLCATIKLDDDDDNAQEIFERINSTGVPLSLADKIRNYALMANAEQDRLYEQYWLPSEQMLGSEQMSNFFIDYLNMKSEGFIRIEEAYDEFKRIHADSSNNSEDILKEVYHYAKQYDIFLHGSANLGDAVNKSLDSLRQLKQTTVYLFLFHVFDDLENGVITEKELARVLTFLLNYSIRRLICEVASNSLRGLYKTLYSRVFAVSENKAHYYDALVSFMQQLTSRDVIPSEDVFRAALKTKNLYRKNALCKYLLISVENRGKEPIHTDTLSIEHIMPQNQHLSTAWQRMLGDNWEKVHDTYLHTLGNLALTGYNSELGDKPFAEKKELLAEQPTHITELYKGVLDREAWNEDTIEERAEKLADIIMGLFAIEQPQHSISFADPRYHEYTVEDPDIATFKYVNYYILLGERVNVDSFALMVRSVAAKLYEYDDQIIERMAKNNEVFPTWLNPVFSYDPERLHNPMKLRKGCDIYIATGFSAKDCIMFIRALLRKHDLSIEDDFVYSARKSSSAEGSLDRIEIIKIWCEGKASQGLMSFDRANSGGRYIRFTTPYLDSVVPVNEEKPSPWKTSNYYFYEITNHEGNLYIQLYFYGQNITDEMKTAYTKLATASGLKKVNKGYTLFFITSKIPHESDDSEVKIAGELDQLFSEVQAYEQRVRDLWPE